MKDIKDYIGKKWAIHCNNSEEADYISTLLNYTWEKLNWYTSSENCINCSQKLHSTQKWYKDHHYSIIEASEFIQPQFEVGAWYKWKSSSGYIGYTLAKFQKITSENLWNCSEWISDNGNHFKNGSHNTGFVHDKDNRILCTKEDLIKYLSKDHPDYPKDELEDLIKEAKQKFPIGSNVKSLVESIPERIIDSFNPHSLTQTKEEIWFYGKPYNILVYNRGKWANLIINDNFITTKTNNQNDTSKTESIKIRGTSISISGISRSETKSLSSKRSKSKIAEYSKPTGIRSIKG